MQKPCRVAGGLRRGRFFLERSDNGPCLYDWFVLLCMCACMYPCVAMLCLVLLCLRAVRDLYPPNCSWFYPPRTKPIGHTARSVEDETRNAELNGNQNPEWWGDLSQLQIQIKQKSQFELYREIPRNSNPIKISIRLCTVRYRDM